MLLKKIALCASLLPLMSVSSLCSAEVSAAVVEDGEELEINRDVGELGDRIAEIRPDRDLFDTAIVLTSMGDRRQLVRCAAFDAGGDLVGRVRVKLPADGVRLVFASDIAGGTDYLGKVSCGSRGQVVGSAYLLGPQFSDLQVINEHDRFGSVVHVPVSLTR